MMNKKQKKRHDEGWTYIETLIVIGIVVILTGTVGFIGMKYIEKAKVITAGSEIENLSLALNSYYLDCRRYPTEDQGLAALWQKPTLDPVPKEWDGPYVDANDFLDPWDNPYIYKVPGPNNLPFMIKSLGADGQEGGEGKDKDVSSTEE